MEEITLITTEMSDDLIVGFAIGTDRENRKQMILLRTLKYESFLDAEERGVAVSFTGVPDDDDNPDMLQTIGIGSEVLEIVTQNRRYAFNTSNLDDDMAEVKKVLKRMNFDQSFELWLT